MYILYYLKTLRPPCHKIVRNYLSLPDLSQNEGPSISIDPCSSLWASWVAFYFVSSMRNHKPPAINSQMVVFLPFLADGGGPEQADSRFALM